MVNLKQMIVGLMFKFREACIYMGKRKPKLMALNSIHFSFNRNIKIGNRMSFPP